MSRAVCTILGFTILAGLLIVALFLDVVRLLALTARGVSRWVFKYICQEGESAVSIVIRRFKEGRRAVRGGVGL